MEKRKTEYKDKDKDKDKDKFLPLRTQRNAKDAKEIQELSNWDFFCAPCDPLRLYVFALNLVFRKPCRTRCSPFTTRKRFDSS